MSNRYFCLFDTETFEQTGRYTGRTPQQAARKCFSSLVVRYKKQSLQLPVPFKLTIKEITINSSKNTYTYDCEVNQIHEQAIRRRVNEFDRLLRSRYGKMKCNKIITPITIAHTKPKAKSSVFDEGDTNREPIVDLVIQSQPILIESNLVIEI